MCCAQNESAAALKSHLLIRNLVDRGVVLHTLRTVRELESVVRLIAAHQGTGHGANDGDFRVAPKTRLEQSSQFRVSVGDIAALLPCWRRERSKKKSTPRHTIISQPSVRLLAVQD